MVTSDILNLTNKVKDLSILPTLTRLSSITLATTKMLDVHLNKVRKIKMMKEKKKTKKCLSNLAKRVFYKMRFREMKVKSIRLKEILTKIRK